MMAEVTASIQLLPEEGVTGGGDDGAVLQPFLVLSKYGKPPLEIPLTPKGKFEQDSYGGGETKVEVRVCGDACTATSHSEATVSPKAPLCLGLSTEGTPLCLIPSSPLLAPGLAKRSPWS